MTEKRENKKLKSLIRFHSAKERRIKNCMAGLGGEGEKKKKKQRKRFKKSK